jgi:hypothetical protein
MKRSHRPLVRATATPAQLRPRFLGWRLRSRELDLLLLAGCSCLITTLSHPVAEALQVRSLNSTTAAVSTHAGQTTQAQIVAMNAAIPAKRDELQDDAAE